jgi:hypothetical protein
MVALYSPPVPWERIHRETFLYEGQCWTTCNGGFCCNHNHPDFQFRLIPTTGSTILYLEDEFRWLTQHGKAPTAEVMGSALQEMTFDFGGPRPLTFMQIHCRLLGKCQGVIDKPLLCKVYPMLPVLGIDGALEDIAPSSVFELTMQVRGSRTPCTVVDKRQHYLNKWRNDPEQLESLRHPYIILHLQAAKHFADVYRDRLNDNEALRGLCGKDFWQAWEMEYLLGNLVDAERLGRCVLKTYGELVDRYGQFLPAA